MSSKETVSIVGSEVMPLDYGSMDSESSPSPSSSEKTVEGVRGDKVVEVGEDEVVGVRGNEVVGVGRDSIPITVVEVEGMREGDYDVNAEIVEEVKQYRPVGVEERACSAPRDHWMPVYAHYLIAGLRFPIPKLLVGGSKRDKGWYYFTPRVASKESRSLFTAGPSSIKGWKENFFFVDDTEWERGDTKVRELASWKAKRANQNRFSLNEDEEEQVRKLVRKRGDLLNIMDLTNAQCIEAVELYGPSALSEAEMDQFLNTVRGVTIPKKPRKKSKTSTKQVDEGRAGKKVVPTISAEVEEEVPQLKRKGWEERKALQKKKKVVEEEERGSEVPQFVPQPLPVELDPKLRQLEEGVEVRAPERELGEWSSPKFMDSVKKRSLLQRQTSESEREAQAKEIALMKDVFMELKENVQVLVHNGMKEHISNFISSSSFDNIVNLYRLPTAIIAFTDCRKKIKLRWELDVDGCAVFPPQFDFEFVAVEEEGAEVEEDEVEAGVEGTEMDESQLVPEVKIHPVPSDDEQPPLPDEQQPTQPPPPAEK
ncbi:hypothetical protein SLEP1_g43711 [Rubroshorea leprosula]|uniref:Uncharacterized protein n=1 Tax=Rubroshorea leprosula TaxID=152421 RepID=A0AAV5LEE7_9ROSI|nr:hypothetical protein SLEP1_g43711 [Rubroshorea leprosula]